MYCTRLKQAQTDEEQEKIKAEMRADIIGGGAAILQALEKTVTAEAWAADRSGMFKSRVRDEARALGAGAKTGTPLCMSLFPVALLLRCGPWLGRPALPCPSHASVLLFMFLRAAAAMEDDDAAAVTAFQTTLPQPGAYSRAPPHPAASGLCFRQHPSVPSCPRL